MRSLKLVQRVGRPAPRRAAAAAGCLLAQVAAIAVAQGDAPLPLLRGAAPVRSCESLLRVGLPNTRVSEAMTVPATAGVPSWCRVTAVVSEPGDSDMITVWIGLPLQNWNGRFQGTGGGGFMVGSPASLTPQVAKGYAAAATDGGLVREAGDNSKPPQAVDGSFALNATGGLDWSLIRDTAYRGIHEMTLTGKAITQAFYGQAAPRAYFNGCSTGGRQGQMEAQRYPDDYDGILSGAPAVNWTKLHIAQMWGQLVMLETKNVVAPCKLAAASAAAVNACDADDGVRDGIIGNPRQCRYDPQDLVGTESASCGRFTATDAQVVREIWQGPRAQDGSFMWYGLQRGADLSALNGSGPNGIATPFPVSLSWWRFFIKQNPGWDWHTLNRDNYSQAWMQSVEEFALISTDDADLSAFRKHGGKSILWHGEADQLIYPQGTIDYFERVLAHSGGGAAGEFMRLFMAPGVAHCAGGSGPQPTGQLDALVSWVEQGRAPDMLVAESRDPQGQLLRTRPLCPFPKVAVYQGRGSSDDARSFKCAAPPKS
jgi:feruloyl esterase